MKWSGNYSDLGVIEGILRKRLYPMSGLEHFEDGIQQGLYRAWQDQEKGGYSEMHVINRAETWARSFFMRPWLPLGHTRKVGIGGFNELSIEKIPMEKLGNNDPNQEWGVRSSKQLYRAVAVEEEDDIVNRLQVEEILSHIRPKYAEALRLRFIQDYELKDIGRVFSPDSTWPKKAGARLVQRALKEAQSVAASYA